MSIASSGISEMLDAKIRQHGLEVSCLETYQEELRMAYDQGKVEAKSFYEEMGSIHDGSRPLRAKLGVLKRQRRAIEDDLSEEYEAEKCRRFEEPDFTFLERAYTTAILPRVMTASAKQKKEKFNGSEFRQEVLKYYSAKHEDLAWCHVTGNWYGLKYVKVAHLVPKSLTSGETFHLFGVDNSIRYDPKVAIPLHERVEEGLDQGYIAIVPVSDSPSITRWRCILVKKDLRNATCFSTADYDGKIRQVRWEELDNKELSFLGENRPARRFLYFRFIMTYINAQKERYSEFLATIENKEVFWPSPGPWLRRLTLTSLARSISGIELPPSIYQDTTFDADASKRYEAAVTDGEVVDEVVEFLRNATISSMKGGDESDEEDSEMDVDEKNTKDL